MPILITGGAGFIGSHTAKLCFESGLDVVVLDNLTTGRRDIARWGAFIEGQICDVALVRRIIRDHGVTAVLHLAASARVGDSMASPEAYFSNNVSASLALLEAVASEGVRRFVFASSSSVYGNAASAHLRENEAVYPVSPYGESKLLIEKALPWYERAHGLHWLALRYFNAAGAEDDLGEEPEGSVRIIPRAVHAAIGDGPHLEVFGTTYPTSDGSAVRDYVHVSDVARANLLALRYVEQGHPGAVVNIGTGAGVSVLQIIEAVARQTGHLVPFRCNLARPGDPAHVIADIALAHELLGWTPIASDLTAIVDSVVRSCHIRAN